MTFIDKIRMQFINVLCSSCNERFSWIFTTILLKINISYRHDHYFITKQCTVANVLNYILVVDYTGMTAPPRCREGHSQVDVRVLGYRDHFLHPVQHLGPPRVEGHHTNHIHHTVHLVVLNPWNHQTWRACYLENELLFLIPKIIEHTGHVTKISGLGSVFLNENSQWHNENLQKELYIIRNKII